MSKIIILGDFMLDKYIFGEVSQISPEAPVPIVLEQKVEYRLGGAGNVAKNIKQLYEEPENIGLIGADPAAKELTERLRNNNTLIISNNRPTTVKTRIMAQNHQLLRLDNETNSPANKQETEELLKQYESKLPETNIVIISDYGKGVIHQELAEQAIILANQQNIKVIVDPKKPNYQFYEGAYLITPNEKEACEMLHSKPEQVNFETAGFEIAKQYGIQNVIITRGSEGMSIYEKNQLAKHIRPTARNVYDVTGAGDTVIATLAVSLQKGLNLYESAQIANYAAGLVVEQIGTTPIDKKSLENKLSEKDTNLLHRFQTE